MRNSHDPLLAAFDAPDGFSGVSQRNVTTTPTQSLLMINGPWMLARAKALAARLKKLQAGNPEPPIDTAYRLLFARRASADEIAAAKEFFQTTESTNIRPIQNEKK